MKNYFATNTSADYYDFFFLEYSRFASEKRENEIIRDLSFGIFGSVALKNAFEIVLFLFSELTAQSH